MGSPEQSYRYLAPSSLGDDTGGRSLLLATSGGTDADGAATHPFFFSGFAEHPEVVAAGLLLVGRVARTRYYTPPNMRAKLLRAADPVVTATPQGLRFESFSACCGVYARLDVAGQALERSHFGIGVTNVDLNPPVRQALAGINPGEPLRLQVGTDELRVSTLDAELTEERVPLPERWLKGLAEVQTVMASMRPVHVLAAAEARRLVQQLPRNSPTGSAMWAVPANRGIRLAAAAGSAGGTADAVCIAGPERLRIMEPMLRFANRLTAFAPESAGANRSASAWVLSLPGAQLTIALSPEKSRGFSGEGGVLQQLGSEHAAGDAALLEVLLAFDPRIELRRLQRESGLSAERIVAALTALATAGQLGYDLAAAAYFHRPLPFDAVLIAALHPRLDAAERLISEDALIAQPREGDLARVLVRSKGAEYHVRLLHSGDDRCTCPWYGRHQGDRGPCKHVLAARLLQERSA